MSQKHTVLAEAVRAETNPDTGEMYLIFEVVDEDFKRRIKNNFIADIELKLVGTKLIKNEE